MKAKTNFLLLAEYNRWMNKNIYSIASKMDDSDLHKDQGAFFGSISATLNHILVGDIIWLKRFASHPSIDDALDYIHTLDPPLSLDTILHSEIDELTAERESLDEIIIQFSESLTNDLLDTELVYSNTKGKVFKKNFSHLIQHFFNHQTHHRGQISCLMSQVGIDLGVTDLLVLTPDM